MATHCLHLDQMRPVEPQAKGCQDCLKTGDSWVKVRLCKTCGHMGCCDSSKNRHARQHFQESGHPIIHGYDSDWLWCYLDNDYVQEAQAMDAQMPPILLDR